MASKSQLAKWHRRTEALHHKLVKLAEDIEASEGDVYIFQLASGAHCEVGSLLSQLDAALAAEPEREGR